VECLTDCRQIVEVFLGERAPVPVAGLVDLLVLVFETDAAFVER
jgi:hypothetical protein